MLTPAAAGRVQSVALRLVAEREAEIEAHVPREYWSVSARLRAPDARAFDARLTQASPAPQRCYEPGILSAWGLPQVMSRRLRPHISRSRTISLPYERARMCAHIDSAACDLLVQSFSQRCSLCLHCSCEEA